MTENQKKILYACLTIGVSSAAVGVAINRYKMKKRREEDQDPRESPDAIIVDIDKGGFLRGLPTPQQLAESRGELGGAKPAGNGTDIVGYNASQMDMDARKKAILKGRRLDFFNSTKAAEYNSSENANEGADDSEPNTGSESKGDDAHKDDDGEKGDNSSSKDSDSQSRGGNGGVLRNSLGQFVSPTDPTAVEYSEKQASDSILEFLKNVFIHPFDTGEKIWEGMKERPIAYAAGGIGGVYLATLIRDKVNSIREKKAKRDYEKARQDYVEMLQNDKTEKTANDNVEANIGTAIAGAFLFPAIITAVLANKIMDRRRAAANRGLASNEGTYPREPIILYRTSGSAGPGTEKLASAEVIELSPEDAMSIYFIKKAMVEGMEKSAEFKWSDMGDIWDIENALELDDEGNITQESIDKMVNDPALNNKIYGLSRKYFDTVTKNSYGAAGADSEVPEGGSVSSNKSKIGDLLAEVRNSGIEFAKKHSKFAKLTNSPAMGDILVRSMTTNTGPNYKQWESLKNDGMNYGLSQTFGDSGMGGAIKKLILWIMKNTGIGNWAIKRQLGKMFGTNSAQQ